MYMEIEQHALSTSHVKISRTLQLQKTLVETENYMSGWSSMLLSSMPLDTGCNI